MHLDQCVRLQVDLSTLYQSVSVDVFGGIEVRAGAVTKLTQIAVFVFAHEHFAC